MLRRQREPRRDWMSRGRYPRLWACAYGVSQYWAYGVGQDAVSQDATPLNDHAGVTPRLDRHTAWNSGTTFVIRATDCVTGEPSTASFQISRSVASSASALTNTFALISR